MTEKTGGRNDTRDKSTTRKRDRHHKYDCNEGEKGTSRVTVGKSFSQILQLIHHVGIANRQTAGDLPHAFERKDTHLNTCIKPARSTDQVRAEIVYANISWAEIVGKIMMDHYDSGFASFTRATGKLNLTKDDFYSAKLTAIQWSKRKFRK